MSASDPPPRPEPLSRAAWADLPHRSVLLASGRDAVGFVDKFTTAAVSRLEPGRGSEGFFTDVRGWVLALVTIMRTEDGLWIDAAAGVAAELRDHLEHYHIREHLTLTDASEEHAAVVVAGPGAEAWLAARIEGAVPTGLFDHGRGQVGGIAVRVARLDWCAPETFLLLAAALDGDGLRHWLATAGIPHAESNAIEAARITHAYPLPIDIPEKTLPQELGRTTRAISFTKGCYLGQETVARLDALGHVNRGLAVVAIEASAPPPPGSPILCGGGVVGTLTSSCGKADGAVGLALVHRRAATGPLTVGGAGARIVAASSPDDRQPRETT